MGSWQNGGKFLAAIAGRKIEGLANNVLQLAPNATQAVISCHIDNLRIGNGGNVGAAFVSIRHGVAIADFNVKALDGRFSAGFCLWFTAINIIALRPLLDPFKT